MTTDRSSTPRTKLGRAVNPPNRLQASPKPKTSKHEPHGSQTNWLRDVILGGQDGLVNILGIILGVIAGGGSRTVLLTAGLAAAITESISMGAVAYTSSISERDYYRAQQAREATEIEQTPDEEREEIRQIYAAKGFAGKLLEDVVETIASNRDVWLNTMMDEELHLEPVQTSRVIRGAVVVTVATLIGHLLPLWPFLILQLRPAVVIAIIVSGLTLFGVGVYSAKTLVGDWRVEGLKMVVIGLGAAAVGFLIGNLFQRTGV